MNRFRMAIGGFFSVFLVALAGYAGERVNPRLNEVLDSLDGKRPELRAVFSATTPEGKQEALLRAFKNRRVTQLKSQRPSLDSGKNRLYAESALKHEFVGQISYPLQFRGEKIDWDTNPFPDYEWICQFHRFLWFPGLGAAYRTTRDERYAAEWALEVNSWVEHMHAPERDKTHPGWSNLQMPLRMIRWAETFADFLPSPSCDGYTLVNYLYTVQKHGERLAALFPDGRLPRKPGNWQVSQLEALLLMPAAYPELRDAEKWAALAIDCIARIQSRVILPDGVINEYIPSYHMSYPRQFAGFMEICERHRFKAKFPESYRDLLQKAVTAVMYWSHPDGTSPVFGDSWLGEENANRKWMAPYLALFPAREDWRAFVTSGREGKYPDLKNYDLPDAGYYMLRSGWDRDALFMILKNTRPVTPMWHDQPDNMTFELSACGRRFMTDSGCYNYSGEPEWREWFRSATAHQLVSLDRKPIQSDKARFLFRNSSPLCESVALENQPCEGLLHRRTAMLLDNRYFLILDELSGKAEGKLRQQFRLDPGPWKLDSALFAARTDWEDSPNLMIRSAASESGMAVEEEEGWFSPLYMRKEKRPAFSFVTRKRKGEKAVFFTALVPVGKGEKQDWPEVGFVRNGDQSESFRGELFFAPAGGGKKYRIVVDGAGGIPSVSVWKRDAD